MKIVLLSIGTRGDIEPFLAIGEILRDNGHQVICAFPEQFRSLAENSDLDFRSLGAEYIDILDSSEGKDAMGGAASGWRKLIANIRLSSKQSNVNKILVQRQYEIIEAEKPDRVVYNANATYPILWELKNCGKSVLISPLPYMHYVEGHSHVAFHSNYGQFLNRLTYSLADFGVRVTVIISKRWLKIDDDISHRQVRNGIDARKVIYTISPHLFPRPEYWDSNLKVLGYPERNKTSAWQPDEAVIEFLKKHNKVLFITFGSMVNPAPGVKTEIFLDILDQNNIPAIFNTASGGLIKPTHYDREEFLFIDEIPYDWIFPRVYGVIHHGGAGTTHQAIKNGCPSMLIPHVIDQYIWNDIISDLGAGPKGIQIEKIMQTNLEDKILDLMNNPSYVKVAEHTAAQMKREDFKDEILRTIIEIDEAAC